MQTQFKRSQIDQKYKWDLKAMYFDLTEWENDWQKAHALLIEIGNFQGNLALSHLVLLNCLETDQSLSELTEKLFVYAALQRDENGADANSQVLIGRAQNLSNAVGEQTAYIVPELLEMRTDALERFYKESPKLLHYKKMIDKIFRKKEHFLPAEQEQLLSQVGLISASPREIFNTLNNADIKFPSVRDENENPAALTKGNYSEFMENTNRNVRKDAFESLYSSYAYLKNTFAANLHANVKSNVFYAKTRKFDSALHASLFNDNVSADLYNNLITAVKANLSPFHKHLRLRREILGLKELRVYDFHAPLFQEGKEVILYDQAYEIMLESLRPLGSDYLNVLKLAKDSGWIDVYENEGKRGGAYSWGAYGSHPYVLLNHKNNLNSMFTLTHEMGHAMHSYLSDKHNRYAYAQYTIFAAEVASTVNEILLIRYLLRQTLDKKKRMYLINHFLEEFRGTVFRQTMLAEFEKIIHERAENGAPLTMDEFSSIYAALYKIYYGDAVVFDPQTALEWCRIPHFYNSFYVYKYATGFSAAVSISNGLLSGDQTKTDDYLAFLNNGGADYPIESLKKAGANMSCAAPINDALRLFAELVDELEVLYRAEK